MQKYIFMLPRMENRFGVRTQSLHPNVTTPYVSKTLGVVACHSAHCPGVLNQFTVINSGVWDSLEVVTKALLDAITMEVIDSFHGTSYAVEPEYIIKEYCNALSYMQTDAEKIELSYLYDFLLTTYRVLERTAHEVLFMATTNMLEGNFLTLTPSAYTPTTITYILEHWYVP